MPALLHFSPLDKGAVDLHHNCEAAGRSSLLQAEGTKKGGEKALEGNSKEQEGEKEQKESSPEREQ